MSPIEIQVYLAKFLVNPRRGEPRNVGLIVRTASDEVKYRFLLDGSDNQTRASHNGIDISEYDRAHFLNVVSNWQETIDKYGVKSLQWVGKRSKKTGQNFYIEFAFGEMVFDFDFDQLFKELIL